MDKTRLLPLRRAITALVYALSAVCFCIALRTGALWASLLAAPFLLLLFITLHELAHALTARLCGSRVTELRVPLLTVKDGRAALNETLFPRSRCTFEPCARDAAVYLCGPLVTALCAAVCVAAFLRRPDAPLRVVAALLAALHLLSNLIPFPHSDLVRFHDARKKRKEP